jgi:outer membrane protein assembly factor BamD
MAAYIFYSDFYFNDAIFELERFLEKYKNHPNTDYAYYLIAICHYNLIVDEKRDLGEIIKSKKYFNILIKNYPNTDFAEDAQYKLQLIEEILASKELYLANYYLQREKWIPAMNRYKKIVNEYDTTIFIEEALFRLVELNFKLGLVEEAKKYTVLLGYNYQSSEWYNRSYEILNKNYKKRTINDNQSKNRESIIKKFKKLFQ